MSKSTLHFNTVTSSQRACTSFVISFFFPPKKTYKIKVSSVHGCNAESPGAELRASSLFQQGGLTVSSEAPRGRGADALSRGPSRGCPSPASGAGGRASVASVCTGSPKFPMNLVPDRCHAHLKFLFTPGEQREVCTEENRGC